jgi:putative FmdB family regulatory protein
VPLYDYQCKNCNEVITEYRQMVDRDKPGKCPDCKSATYPILTIPGNTNYSSMYPYNDEYIDAKPVTIHSRSHYKKELAKRNLIEKGRSMGSKGQWV